MQNLRSLVVIAAFLSNSLLAHAAGVGGGGTLTGTAIGASPNPASSTATVRVEATVSPFNEGTMKFFVDGQETASLTVSQKY